MISSTPSHVAIIMDGNGRWAKSHSLSAINGHREGAKNTKKIIKHALKIGIKYVTLYIFSSENWNRCPIWISEYMRLIEEYLKSNIKELLDLDLSIKFIGDLSLFSKTIQELCKSLENKTKHCSSMNLIFALGYGGRNEIVSSINRMLKSNDYLKKEISEDDFNKFLDTNSIPDPELLIRTGSEKRISNFLLWQIAYTELYFSEKLWPDFSIEDFEYAISDYKKRSRRFGR